MHFLCWLCELHFDRKKGRIFHAFSCFFIFLFWSLKETRKGNDHLVVMIGGDLMKGSQELHRSVLVLKVV